MLCTINVHCIYITLNKKLNILFVLLWSAVEEKNFPKSWYYFDFTTGENALHKALYQHNFSDYKDLVIDFILANVFFFIITFFYWAVPQFLKLACGYKMQRLICASSYHRLCGRQRSENAVFKPSLRPSGWHFPVSPSLISCPVSLHRLWVTGHIRQADRSTAANDNILLKASESKWMFLLFSICVFTRNLTLTLDFLQPSACSVDVCRDACMFIPFKYLSSRKSLPEMKEKMMMTS